MLKRILVTTGVMIGFLAVFYFALDLWIRATDWVGATYGANAASAFALGSMIAFPVWVGFYQMIYSK